MTRLSFLKILFYVNRYTRLTENVPVGKKQIHYRSDTLEIPLTEIDNECPHE